MKTITVFSITFNKDVYAEYVRLGRLITGIHDISKQSTVTLPFGEDGHLPVITHLIDGEREAFKLKDHATASLTPDTIEIHLEGILRDVTSKQLVTRAKQALHVIGWADIVEVIDAEICVSFTVTERIPVEV